MTPDVQIVLSGALTFGIPLVFAVNELRALRRPRRGPDDRDAPPSPAPPSPGPGGEAAPRPLPACLIPTLPPRQPAAARSRRAPELV